MRWDFWRKQEPDGPPPPPADPEDTGNGAGAYDIFNRLLGERIVFIGTPIDDTISSLISAQLLYLQHQDPKGDIKLYLNSPGGSVTASLAIHDTMMSVKNDVATYAIGRVVGTAALLMCAGRRGKRFGLPHSMFGFAEVWAGAKATAEEERIQQEEIARLQRAVYEAYARHTGKSAEFIESQHGTGRCFGPEEALRLGLIDRVIETVP